MYLVSFPETVISSSPSPPYDGMVSNALALRSPRRHRPPLGARKRKTLLCRLGRRHARVDVTDFVPRDSDCIITVVALQCRVSDALALLAPGGIAPFSALGKGRRSSTTSDAGMLAKTCELLIPETMIASLPSPPYDAGF